MTKEEASRKLSLHMMQCGAMMPIEWVENNGEGSELMTAFRMVLDALREQEERSKVVSNADRIRAMSDEELANLLTDYSNNGGWISETGREVCYERIAEWLQQPVKEDA